MTKSYLRTPEAAVYLGVSLSTLEKKRVDGTGPKFRQLSKRLITYAVEDLDAWAGRQVYSSTSERAAA